MPKRTTAALGVLMALALGTGVVLASHQFPDVPDTNQFHDDIEWLVDNGITSGYANGNFGPKDNITRQAFAAFLHDYDTNLGQTEYGVASIEVKKGERLVHSARLVLDPARVADRRHDRRRVPLHLRRRGGTLRDRCGGSRAFGHRHRRHGSLPPARVGDEGRRRQSPAR